MINLKHSFIRLFALLAIIICISCTGDSRMGYERVKANPIHSVPQINDTIFLSAEINAIRQVGGNYVISEENKVYYLNKNFSFNQIIGNSGRGPGEYLFPVGVYRDKSGLYVASSDNKLKRYTWLPNYERWKFEDDIPIPNFFGYPNSFIKKDDFIYVTRVHENLVEKRNSKGEVVETFGAFNQVVPERRFMHILGEEDFIYLIGISEPVIFKYTFNGVLKISQNYYEHEAFKTSVFVQEKFYEKNPKNVTSMILKDACLIGNKIFILFMDRKAQHSTDPKILVVDKESLHISHVMDLPGSYSSICPSVDKTKLVAHNLKNGNIEVYNVQELIK